MEKGSSIKTSFVDHLADAFSAIFSFGMLGRPKTPWRDYAFRHMSENASHVPQRAAAMMNHSWKQTVDMNRDKLLELEQEYNSASNKGGRG